MKILIASDKWKGTFSALEACAAIGAEMRRLWPEAMITELPIADGGEGTARALYHGCGGQWITLTVTGPLGDPVEAGYALLPDEVAVMEMAAASGLALTGGRRDPWRATTRGTGEMLLDAALRGARQIILGIGGSATNDGGVGLAAALGWQFDQLPIATRVVAPPATPPLAGIEVLAACDVTNPLLGPRGCTRVFGPQKGVKEEDFPKFEAALAGVAAYFPPELAETPGAGAAGGLGFGLLAFVGARLVSGFGLVAEVLHLADRVAEADLVITGEGSLDDQTLDGKGPHGVAELARRHGKPVVGIGGRVTAEAAAAFDLALAITPAGMLLEEAQRRAPELLANTVRAHAAELMSLLERPAPVAQK